jgi:hypothetical protein
MRPGEKNLQFQAVQILGELGQLAAHFRFVLGLLGGPVPPAPIRA